MTRREQYTTADIQRTLNLLPKPAWVFDEATFAFLAVNDVAVRQYGFSRDQFMRMTIRDIRPHEDVAAIEAAMSGANVSAENLGEWRHRRADGEIIQVEITASSILLEGRKARLVLARDVSERDALIRQLETHKDLMSVAGRIGKFGGWQYDPHSEQLRWSEEAALILNMDAGARSSVEDASELFVPGCQGRFRQALSKCVDRGRPFDEELELVSGGERRKWVRLAGAPKSGAGKTQRRAQGAIQDISDVRNSEEQLRLIESCVNHVDDMVIITKAAPIESPGPEIVYVNDAFVEHSGYSREEAIGDTPRILQGAGTEREELDRIRTALEREESVRAELTNYAKSGDELLLELDIAPVRDARQNLTHFVSVQRDISERRRAEQALAQSESRFRAAAQATADVIWDWDLKKNTVWWNEGYVRAFGHPPPSDQAPLDSWTDHIHSDDRDRVVRSIGEAVETRAREWSEEYRFVDAHGRERLVADRGYLLLDSQGKPDRFVGGMRDLTEREAANVILQRNSARLGAHIEQIRSLTRSAVYEDSLLMTRICEAAQKLARSHGAAIEIPRANELVCEASCGAADSLKGTRLDAGSGLSASVLKNGKPLICDDTNADDDPDALAAHRLGFRSMIVALLPGETGPRGVLKLLSQEPHAFSEEDLGFINLFGQSAGAILERRTVERRLNQAQRLKSVGELTGGVAHDFNNLLTVILGNAESFEDALKNDDTLSPLAKMTRMAAERGAELTSRLLAFSRQQPLEPSSTDINRLLSSMDALLRRTLGEHIEISMIGDDGVWPAMIDPIQLESAILNLCLNARDAMPRGGRLIIEARNTHLDDGYADMEDDVTSGEYVMVAVSDTGEGMTQDVMNRAFDPFFTTKDAGKGSGMGLSMVFGFIKQSGGHIKIYSELGAGTTIRLYLPKAQSAPAAEDGEESDSVFGHGEKILLVEDDDLVRGHVLSQLRILGYEPIEARNAREALDALRLIADIQLLFTDVVMPGGMSGKELADAAVKLKPGLKVLFTSGYTENAIVHHGRLDAGVNFISKPYRQGDLGRKIRQALA